MCEAVQWCGYAVARGLPSMFSTREANTNQLYNVIDTKVCLLLCRRPFLLCSSFLPPREEGTNV